MAVTATDAALPLRSQVLGVPVDVCPDVFAAALALRDRGGGQIVTLNAEMTMAARSDGRLGRAIAAAELVIPDGAGVVWALGRRGLRVRRSPGIELARRLLEHGAAQHWRVALLGASPAVMEQLLQRLRAEIPALEPVFAAHGYQPAEAWPALEAR
ncbi:MAG: WecB/TagA/CpsF family glycosyltransferase, partial [Synechococcaceae cyanobacterium]